MKSMMPSFKSPVAKARWLAQNRVRVPNPIRCCPNFTRAEVKRKRTRDLAKQILRLQRSSEPQVEPQVYLLGLKLARMVLR